MNMNNGPTWIAVCTFIALSLVALMGAKIKDNARQQTQPRSSFATLLAAPLATYQAIITPNVGDSITCKSSSLTFSSAGIQIPAGACHLGIFGNGFEVQP